MTRAIIIIPGQSGQERVGRPARNALLASLCLSACATIQTAAPAPPPATAIASSDRNPQPTIHVTCPHVPAPQETKPPARPVSASALVLQQGHWDWTDGSYVWTAAQWQPKGDVSTTWQDGFWEVNGGACVWHTGAFRSAANPR